MKLSIATYGTVGEILPHAALAQRLQQRGHDVRLALPPSLMHYTHGLGLDVVPCRPDMSPRLARDHAANFSSSEPHLPAQAQLSSRARYQDLLEACRGSDVLIASWFPAISALLRETQNLPWIQAQPTAGTLFHPSHEQDQVTLESGRAPSSGDPYLAAMHLQWSDLRNSYGLPPRETLNGYFRPNMLLAGVSPLLFPQPFLPTSPQPNFTGFWLLDHPAWRPDRELARFLERRPIVLSFSSLPLVKADEVLNLHARAALKLGRPLLVLSGWAGLDAEDLRPDVPRSQVLLRGFEPFRNICASAACAIIHGGIGSLADAILAGCPLLIEPYGGDQFLNARQVLRLGIGAVADKDKLTETSLARLLKERVLLPEVKQRVEALGRRMRAENGLDTACDLIENFRRIK